MTTYERLDAAGLRHRFPDDELAHLAVSDDAIVVSDGQGWAALGPWGGNRSDFGGFGQLADPGAALAELVRLASAEGHTPEWFTVDRGRELALPAGYRETGHGSWDLMATRGLVDDAAPADVRFVELDDVADADEIRTFGHTHNPDFHGHPGTGQSLLWLGIRDDAGALIGVGTLEQCGPRQASGFCVPHAAGLVVDERQRGRGLGRALIVELTRRALALDGVCTLGVFAGNAHAIALYEGIGYHRVSANETTDFELPA